MNYTDAGTMMSMRGADAAVSAPGGAVQQAAGIVAGVAAPRAAARAAGRLLRKARGGRGSGAQDPDSGHPLTMGHEPDEPPPPPDDTPPEPEGRSPGGQGADTFAAEPPMRDALDDFLCELNIDICASAPEGVLPQASLEGEEPGDAGRGSAEGGDGDAGDSSGAEPPSPGDIHPFPGGPDDEEVFRNLARRMYLGEASFEEAANFIRRSRFMMGEEHEGAYREGIFRFVDDWATRTGSPDDILETLDAWYPTDGMSAAEYARLEKRIRTGNAGLDDVLQYVEETGTRLRPIAAELNRDEWLGGDWAFDKVPGQEAMWTALRNWLDGNARWDDYFQQYGPAGDSDLDPEELHEAIWEAEALMRQFLDPHRQIVEGMMRDVDRDETGLSIGELFLGKWHIESAGDSQGRWGFEGREQNEFVDSIFHHIGSPEEMVDADTYNELFLKAWEGQAGEEELAQLIRQKIADFRRGQAGHAYFDKVQEAVKRSVYGPPPGDAPAMTDDEFLRTAGQMMYGGGARISEAHDAFTGITKTSGFDDVARIRAEWVRRGLSADRFTDILRVWQQGNFGSATDVTRVAGHDMEDLEALNAGNLEALDEFLSGLEGWAIRRGPDAPQVPLEDAENIQEWLNRIARTRPWLDNKGLDAFEEALSDVEIDDTPEAGTLADHIADMADDIVQHTAETLMAGGNVDDRPPDDTPPDDTPSDDTPPPDDTPPEPERPAGGGAKPAPETPDRDVFTERE